MTSRNNNLKEICNNTRTDLKFIVWTKKLVNYGPLEGVVTWKENQKIPHWKINKNWAISAQVQQKPSFHFNTNITPKAP